VAASCRGGLPPFLCELISRATAAIEGRFRHIVSASPKEMKRNDTIHPGKSAKAAELSGAQDQKRTNHQIATGIAIVVFWPAAFLVGGDGQVAAVATSDLKSVASSNATAHRRRLHRER
jgi:hypothetical protein